MRDPAKAQAPVQILAQVGHSRVYLLPAASGPDAARRAFGFRGGMTIDADGSPRAYHPADAPGLDALANAGRPGDWWALATDDGKASGRPVIQGEGDPRPGFYVSTTALVDRAKRRTDPARYVDSEAVPFIVLPPQVRRAGGAALGDLGVALNLKNDKLSAAIFADAGPRDHLGEGSIRLAEALGIDADPRTGGAAGSTVAYLVFPGSAAPWPRPTDAIESQAEALLTLWGGVDRLRRDPPA